MRYVALLLSMVMILGVTTGCGGKQVVKGNAKAEESKPTALTLEMKKKRAAVEYALGFSLPGQMEPVYFNQSGVFEQHVYVRMMGTDDELRDLLKVLGTDIKKFESDKYTKLACESMMKEQCFGDVEESDKPVYFYLLQGTRNLSPADMEIFLMRLKKDENQIMIHINAY